MSVEKRTRLVEEEFYVCSDGTEFEMEDDAEVYEADLMRENFIMLNSSYEKCCFEESCFVKLRTEEEVKKYNKVIANYLRNVSFSETGYYYILDGFSGNNQINMGKAIQKLDEIDKSGI